MPLQAAVDGQGLASGRSALAQDDLLAGRLVRPFALSLPSQYALYVVTPEHTANRQKIRERWGGRPSDGIDVPGLRVLMARSEGGVHGRGYTNGMSF